MFTDSDLKQMEQRGSELDVVNQQIENFKKGFPFLALDKPATPADGIEVLDDANVNALVEFYDANSSGILIVKFVPASGAASRMFKSLFTFLDNVDDADYVESALNSSSDLQSIKTFFKRIKDFAFADDLDANLIEKGSSLESCIEQKDYEAILRAILGGSHGLAYASLPKGLLKFHKYDAGSRTPVMEHLSEGALYATSANKVVKIHFTVSPEHREKFEEHIKAQVASFQKTYDVTYEISFSEQKAFTDTIAVDLQNEPFRNNDGSLLFRPAGHGALIANLNDIDADIIFVKNIDNVVPDKLKNETVTYKKVLAGTLLKYQEKIFDYLKQLDGEIDANVLDEMMTFVKDDLHIHNIPTLADEADKVEFLKEKLNRPLRICGMVKNEGEPGGGPFFAENSDGTQSLQIAESSQIDMSNTGQKAIASSATHFNPVDLVCGVRNYKGDKFDLTQFVDPSTGFISQKSKDGKDLKAQELPGLWNGSMSDWNTLFVEVPISTFNPVKTVNDLLRPQHQ